MTTAPVERRRAPLLAASALLGLGVLAAGAWFSLRHDPAPETSNQVVQATTATTAAASAVTPEVSAAAPIEVVPSAAAAPIAPRVSTAIAGGPSPRITGAAKSTPKPAAPTKKPVVDETNYTRR